MLPREVANAAMERRDDGWMVWGSVHGWIAEALRNIEASGGGARSTDVRKVTPLAQRYPGGQDGTATPSSFQSTPPTLLSKRACQGGSLQRHPVWREALRFVISERNERASSFFPALVCCVAEFAVFCFDKLCFAHIARVIVEKQHVNREPCSPP